VSLLSADQILAADDRKYEVVPVPEWGGDVRLRSLTGAELDEFENSMERTVGNKVVRDVRNVRAKLIAMSAVDASGQLLFTKGQVIKLGSKNAAPMMRLFQAVQRLSGIDDEAVKEMEETFEPAPNGASTSVSQPTSAPVPSPNSWPVSAPAS